MGEEEIEYFTDVEDPRLGIPTPGRVTVTNLRII
jgi:hypothetical protein